MLPALCLDLLKLGGAGGLISTAQSRQKADYWHICYSCGDPMELIFPNKSFCSLPGSMMGSPSAWLKSFMFVSLTTVMQKEMLLQVLRPSTAR